MSKLKRLYIDTSVFGGVFDVEFQKISRAFFDQAAKNTFILTTSELVRQEIQAAPKEVIAFFDNMLGACELVDVTREAYELQQAYFKAGILSRRHFDDALHVAICTSSGCNGIISWNLKHIVHYQKIPKYNAVNVLKGYQAIFIHSPQEVCG
ncbi:MAG: type II toxin-antitoxin system VapC family toxin [Candidatus Wallbacteria bacterium]|nr:type II toxin-antitoxin system VapC family toxin [Candidatus Wallbacteria bacterium]